MDKITSTSHCLTDAKDEGGGQQQRQLFTDRALLLLNRVGLAQGLANVFEKGSSVRPATDFFKIVERHHYILDQLFDKLEEQMASESVVTVASLKMPSDEVPKSNKNKRKAQRREWRKKQRADHLHTAVEDPLSIDLSLYRTKLFKIVSFEGLNLLADQLGSVKEFAFDFELTCFKHPGHPREQQICLMQISTEDIDFLIDVLVPVVRENFCHFLGDVFSSKKIRKVCHGVQECAFLRQLGIFHAKPLVDTSGGARRNLQSLVYEACGVWLDKRQSTADWTRRPLTRKMEDYARCDTHYLLRCYHYLEKAGRL